MEAICIKSFSYVYSTFIKNISYELVEYENEKYFYVGIIPIDKKAPYAMYPIDIKFRYNFATLIDQRKIKLQKINNESKK